MADSPVEWTLASALVLIESKSLSYCGRHCRKKARRKDGQAKRKMAKPGVWRNPPARSR